MSKSDRIKELLDQTPHATENQIVAALAAEEIDVTRSHVRVVRGRWRKERQWWLRCDVEKMVQNGADDEEIRAALSDSDHWGMIDGLIAECREEHGERERQRRRFGLRSGVSRLIREGASDDDIRSALSASDPDGSLDDLIAAERQFIASVRSGDDQ